MTIAIIGAGVAGATCAHTLRDQVDCRVFEKSRGIGGRLATRRHEDAEWDHGAPYFTARSKAFQAFLQPAIASGQLQTWIPRQTTLEFGQPAYKRSWFEPHYIGVPTMKDWLKPRFDRARLTLNTQIDGITGQSGAWFLHANGHRFGPFKWVISTVPLDQSQAIFQRLAEMPHAEYLCQWALLARLEQAPSWSLALAKDSIIERLTINSSKPERASPPTLVATAQPAWSRDQFDQPHEAIKAKMQAAVESLLDQRVNPHAVHRWRYAKVLQPHTERFWLEGSQQLGGCGDWGGNEGVEAAFLSAKALTDQLQTHLR